MVRSRHLLIIMGLFGAALIYGDGIITPAISVLSALEGLTSQRMCFKPHIVSMAVAILFGLFAIQSRGTAVISQGIWASNAGMVRRHRRARRGRHFPLPRS